MGFCGYCSLLSVPARLVSKALHCCLWKPHTSCHIFVTFVSFCVSHCPTWSHPWFCPLSLVTSTETGGLSYHPLFTLPHPNVTWFIPRCGLASFCCLRSEVWLEFSSLFHRVKHLSGPTQRQSPRNCTLVLPFGKLKKFVGVIKRTASSLCCLFSLTLRSNCRKAYKHILLDRYL